MKDLNDYELVSLAQENNEEAGEILYTKYRPLIQKLCHKYFKYVQNKGIEFTDLVQECTIGFEEAVLRFNENDNTSFYTFVTVCMERQLMSEVTKQNRDKHKFLNEAVPLESIDSDSDINLIDYIEDNRNNPEQGLLLDEDFKELYLKIVGKLTDFEECVFRLKLQNFDYREIAGILDRDQKSIDNAIQRIRLKIKNII